MTDAEYLSLADATLEAVQRAFDRVALDVDVQTKGTGVLEVEFENGAKIVINRHAPAREIWIAARAGGFHFRHDGEAWRDTRDGTELFAALSRLVSAQAGTAVVLTSA